MRLLDLSKDEVRGLCFEYVIFRAHMFSICSVACSKEMEKGIWERFLKQKLLDKSHDGPKETWKGKWVAS